ncbi:MAG: hypothetical protein PHY45_06485 [Rhodocyclaceae bacterium]|nr:hypothetical protein [Rhodocyclaceae bacterium]
MKTSPTFRYAKHIALAVVVLAMSSSSYADTLTRTSAFDYDPSTGLLTKEIIEPGNSNLCLVTQYVYDRYGNKTSATTHNCSGATGSSAAKNSEAAAPKGDAVIAPRTTSNAYDARGQFPTTSSNALNQSETKTYDTRFGAVTSLTGLNALTTKWQYDNFGRKAQESRADGTKTKWDYLYCNGINGGTYACPTVGGAAGAYVIVTTPLASGGVTQNGAIGKTYYDALDREIRIETQGYDGSGANIAIYLDTKYDSLGRPYMKSRPYYAGQTAYWSTVTYDSFSRPIQIVDADNATTTMAYYGLRVKVTNPKGQIRTTIKNSQGQIISVTDAQNQTITYAYDPFGNLTKTTDPLGNATVLTYDLWGRKTRMQDPDMGIWTYAYDAIGQLIRQVDAKGQTTTMSYDLLGRMTNRSEADLISNWYYDTYKNGVPCPKGIGKLCQSETSTGYSRIIAYDLLGRPIQTTTTIDTIYIDGVAYDTNGRVSSRTYPGGVRVNYLYTTLGYLKSIQDSSSGTPYWTANALDAENHLQHQTYGNGVQTQQTYNPANGRVTAIVAGAGNAVQNLAYTYDTLGNIASRTDASQSLTEGFLYDSLNRLTSATVNSSGAGIVTQSFAYDGIGNITSRSDVGTYTYPASGASSQRPHAISRINLVGGGYRTYSWDKSGNLSSEVTYDASNNPVPNKRRTEVYTSFNMPLAFGAPGISAAYQYGSEHQRVEEVSSSQGTTIYLNPGNNGDLFYEKQVKIDNSQEQRSYLTAYGMVVGVVKQITISGATTTLVHYFHRDNLNSTTAVTDKTGAVIEQLAYEAFGKRRFPNGVKDPNNTIVGINTERGFTNHEHIDELGLVHMNGRIYDPTIGRFVSPDPTVQSPYNLQSYNRYSYTWNNPLSYTDPSGYFNLGKALGLDGALRSITNTVNAFLDNPVRGAAIIVAAYYTGQWLGNTLAASASGTAAGSSWAVSSTAGVCTATGESVITGYTLTAAGSATVAASSTFAASYLASGGDFQAGLRGAASGAILGGVDGYYGNAWGLDRVAANAVAGGISSRIQGGSFADGFTSRLGLSALTYANYLMRQDMIRSSLLDPDSGNAGGKSSGFFGDFFKLGGARFVDGLICDSPLGGCQGGPGRIGPFSYSPGSFGDRLVEAYAGPHDYLNSGYWYDEFGNGKNLTGLRAGFGEALNALNVVPATPFAAAGLIQTSGLEGALNVMRMRDGR